MKVTTIKVEACYVCPHRRIQWYAVYCDLKNLTFVQADEKRDFPKWCPLPDAPSEESGARK